MSSEPIGLVLEGLVYVPREAAAKWEFLPHADEDGSSPYSELAPYLFASRSGVPVFHDAQKRLHELNNLFVLMSKAVEGERNLEKSTLDMTYEILAQSFPDWDDEEDESFFEVDYVLSMTSYNRIGEIYVPASALVLLYAAFIQTLHSIVVRYGGDKASAKLRARRSGLEIDNIVHSLEDVCGRGLKSLRSRRIRSMVYSRARKVRNAFLHGDWRKCEIEMIGTRIVVCFDCIRVALEELDQALSGRVPADPAQVFRL